MVRLTRLNGTVVHVNADLVATVEEHHDTVVTLVDGKTYVVQESADEVVQEVVAYRGAVLAAAERIAAERIAAEEAQPAAARLVVLPQPIEPEIPPTSTRSRRS